MIDTGHAVEAYRQAANPADALDTITADLAGANQTRELEAVMAEHRKRFPEDPLLLMLAGQQAAAKQDWALAGRSYREGWKQLPDAKKQRWSYGYLFACFKQGQVIEGYHETGKRPEHFRTLAGLMLRDKQIDMFERLLEAHRIRGATDAEFDAYEARLKILRGKPDDAADLFANTLKTLPLQDHRRVAESLQADLVPFDFAAEMYRCLPDKVNTFAQLVWRYRNPQRVKDLERLMAASTPSFYPDDPRLVIERAELHMLRNEFAQAEEQFLLARAKGSGNQNLGRFGLIRARVKLGKAAETYHELGANALAFQDVVNQCAMLKDAGQLERVVAEHRKAFPLWKEQGVWEAEICFLKKDYEGVLTVIRANQASLLRNSTYRWKCEGYLVRSLVRLQKPKEAVQEAEAINKRKDGPRILLALALASTGDVARVQKFLETQMRWRDSIEASLPRRGPGANPARRRVPRPAPALSTGAGRPTAKRAFRRWGLNGNGAVRIGRLLHARGS